MSYIEICININASNIEKEWVYLVLKEKGPSNRDGSVN